MLLAEAEQHADNKAGDGTEHRDQPSLQEEDAADHRLIGSHVREDAYIFCLVDDQHGKRPDDIKAGDEQDEDQQHNGQQFLDP